jgi:hypothetical protein
LCTSVSLSVSIFGLIVTGFRSLQVSSRMPQLNVFGQAGAGRMAKRFIVGRHK